jgi:HSP20 family protein
MVWDVDLWREMERLRSEMGQLFSNWGGGPAGATAYPPVNVYEDRETVTVTAELPGLTKDQVSMTFSGGVVSLAGKREPVAKAAAMVPVRQERTVGEFEKTLRIPTKVQSDRITASFANGVLTVTLPKAEEAKPKTIAIEAQ